MAACLNTILQKAQNDDKITVTGVANIFLELAYRKPVTPLALHTVNANHNQVYHARMLIQ